jgi:hypothetical protein
MFRYGQLDGVCDEVPVRRQDIHSRRCARPASQYTAGAGLGEILVTASAITGGDEASWRRAYKDTAERLRVTGEHALAAEHRVSAREALLRASSDYRNAEDFLLEKPAVLQG